MKWTSVLIAMFGLASLCAAGGGEIVADSSVAEIYNWGDHGSGSLYKVEALGEIIFADDDGDVAHLAAGSYLIIRQAGEGGTVRCEYRASAGGVPQRAVTLDDQPLAAAAAERWLTEHLPLVIRRTGLGVERRVERLLDLHGLEGVLEEIQQLQRPWVKRIYFTELMTHDWAAEQIAAIRAAAERQLIGEEAELRRVLEQIEA